jgi:diaminopimelate decarboxylase
MAGSKRYFTFQKNELYCDGVSASAVAQKAGTPVYVYSSRQIASRFDEFDRALGKHPHLVCYAVKANSNLSVLRLLAKRGSGFDIVSGGELFRVLQAGGKANRTVFSGVGKTASEIDYALRCGVLMFNCESESELRLISERAKKLRAVAPVALRVNPQVNAKTHPYIATGLEEHKFGIEMNVAEELYEEAQAWPGLRIAGLSCHIGSQISDLEPFAEAVKKLLAMAARLKKKGLHIEHLDVGGGLAVSYRPEEKPPSIQAYGKQLVKLVRGTGLRILIEPGRSIVGDAGILLTRVVHTKKTGRKEFVIVDAAMNDLIRPSLYGAHHEVEPVVRERRENSVVDLVGPVCESTDFFAKNRKLPRLKPGDLLSISTAGAYGFVLSSNYNSRTRPPEVMVDVSKWTYARRRETLKDLIRGE